MIIATFLSPLIVYRIVACQGSSLFDFESWVVLLLSHSVVSDSGTPWTVAHEASLSFTISWSLLKRMSIESVIASSHLILCCLLLLLPSVFPSTVQGPITNMQNQNMNFNQIALGKHITFWETLVSMEPKTGS